MGTGLHAEKPPPDAAHPPYIQVYLAAGGWQSQCVSWDGDHWDCWETGGGPYRWEREARADATAWAKAWGIEARLPTTPADDEPADDLLTTLGKQFPNAEITRLDDGAIIASLGGAARKAKDIE
jgi:hypothetical protein